jgi:hypothetical protein
MRDDDRLRKLKSFRDELDRQDAILREGARAKRDYEVPIPSNATIKRIFDSILADFPNSIPSFDFHGDPSAVLAQISTALSTVQRMIEAHEREAEEEAKRYELRVSVSEARALLKDRIEEGEAIADNPEYALRYGNSSGEWSRRTFDSLSRVFGSQLNAQDFVNRMKPHNLFDLVHAQNNPGIEARWGVEYLRSIDEQLFILQHPLGLTKTEAKTKGKRIFIGHGRSLVWLKLKNFIEERLHLPVDEFNRAPAAGMFTGDRLKQMLDEACFAFLVMNAEDQQPDGTFRARENVVHEAGLFQGRLGFMRAIILLEEGCETFSNIHGLTVLQFSKDHIDAKFEEIRQTLEREGILPTGDARLERGV